MTPDTTITARNLLSALPIALPLAGMMWTCVWLLFTL
jgi:hypothetical protein